MFNSAIDAKLCGCDRVQLRLREAKNADVIVA